MRSSSIVLAVSLLLGSSACYADIPDDTTTIVLTGDILLDRGVRQTIERHGVGHLFSDGIDSVFQSAQVVVGNLECPATKIKSPVFKRFIFRGEPEWLDTLRQHGITHLNLANNHSIDQGREGLMDTRRNILAAGMVPIGAGANMQEASEPVLLAQTVDACQQRVHRLLAHAGLVRQVGVVLKGEAQGGHEPHLSRLVGQQDGF